MKCHDPTIANVTGRTAEGKSKLDMIRLPQALRHPRDLYLLKPTPATGVVAG
jgi:hypothetical protein